MRADTLDQHPPTIKAADRKTTLRRFTMAGVLYARDATDARRRFEELRLHGWTHAEITDGYDHETAAEERAEALRDLVAATDRYSNALTASGRRSSWPAVASALARAGEVLESTPGDVVTDEHGNPESMHTAAYPRQEAQ